MKGCAKVWTPNDRNRGPKPQAPRKPEGLPRNRMAGSHAGMTITEHHRGPRRKA